MGIYAWECKTCWRTAEVIVPVGSRDDAVTCACGAAMSRLPTAASFRMPGGNPRIDYEHAFNSDLYGRAEADAIKGGAKK